MKKTFFMSRFRTAIASGTKPIPIKGKVKQMNKNVVAIVLESYTLLIKGNKINAKPRNVIEKIKEIEFNIFNFFIID